MKPLLLILLLGIAIVEPSVENVMEMAPTADSGMATASPPAADDEAVAKISSNDIDFDHLNPMTPNGGHFPLPPVLTPGILNNYEPMTARRKRSKRMLLSELRFLKNQYLPLERSLNRIRRSSSPSIAKNLMSRIPMSLDRGNQRDLRRLRRDLGYETQPDFSSYQYPMEVSRNSVYGQREHRATAIKGRELERLLQRLEFLEQLESIAQERQLIPATSPEAKQQRRILHAPPSRFAPQPKLFLDDDLEQQRSPRVEEQLGKLEEIPEDYMWIPEKRWSKSSGSLSMIPGFKKRSVFREAALQQMVNQRSKRQQKFSSMATSLGIEVDPDSNVMRRSAM